MSRESLFIEATFEFPECADGSSRPATVPDHYEHMLLESADALPRVRFRLEAQLVDGEVEDESFVYVTESDQNDEPLKVVKVSSHERHRIHVHYIPANRDPSDQVSFGQATML